MPVTVPGATGRITAAADSDSQPGRTVTIRVMMTPIRVSLRLVGSEEMDEGRKITETRDVSEPQCQAFKFLARRWAGPWRAGLRRRLALSNPGRRSGGGPPPGHAMTSVNRFKLGNCRPRRQAGDEKKCLQKESSSRGRLGLAMASMQSKSPCPNSTQKSKYW